MNCKRVQSSLSEYWDGRLPGRERQKLSSHLTGCTDCATRSEQLIQLRGALRALPPLAPPSHLSTSLRVLASRELARRSFHEGIGSFLSHCNTRAKLWLQDMMRPVALPLAGGLLSTLILFGMLVPTFAVPESSGIQDVPTGLSTEATVIRMGPFGFSEDDITLLVTVNEQGRMVDYSTPSGQVWMPNPRARRSVENLLLFTEFSPGTMFGQPAAGKVRVNFRRSEIDVRG